MFTPPSEDPDQGSTKKPPVCHKPDIEEVKKSASPSLKSNINKMKRTPQPILSQSRLTSSGSELRVHPVALTGGIAKAVAAPQLSAEHPEQQQQSMEVSPTEGDCAGRLNSF